MDNYKYLYNWDYKLFIFCFNSKYSIHFLYLYITQLLQSIEIESILSCYHSNHWETPFSMIHRWSIHIIVDLAHSSDSNHFEKRSLKIQQIILYTEQSSEHLPDWYTYSAEYEFVLHLGCTERVLSNSYNYFKSILQTSYFE